MNWDIVEGHWKQFKGELTIRWGRLTQSHARMLSGRQEKQLGRIQIQHGLAHGLSHPITRDWESADGGFQTGL